MKTKLDDIYKQMHDQTQQLHICTKHFVEIIEFFRSRLSNREVEVILTATHPVFRENVHRLLYGLLYNLDRLYHESQILMKQIYQLHEQPFWEEYTQTPLCDTRLLQPVKHQFTQVSEVIDDCRSTYNVFFKQYQNCTQQVHAGKTLWEEITPIVEDSRDVLWKIEKRYDELKVNFNKSCDYVEKLYMDPMDLVF